MTHKDVTIVFRPIEKWPRGLLKPGERRGATFKSPYDKTVRELKEELARINVGEAVLQVAVPESSIRADGQLRGDRAAPAHPGVILAFERKGVGPLKFPCDTFTTMRDNVRAIRLSLEALRAVDRYGVTSTGEQYRGWAELPPPGGVTSAPAMSPDQAAEALIRLSGDAALQHDQAAMVKVITGSKNFYQSVCRDAIKKHHTDAVGGGTASPEWYELQSAKDVLDKHHGL